MTARDRFAARLAAHEETTARLVARGLLLPGRGGVAHTPAPSGDTTTVADAVCLTVPAPDEGAAVAGASQGDVGTGGRRSERSGVTGKDPWPHHP